MTDWVSFNESSSAADSLYNQNNVWEEVLQFQYFSHSSQPFNKYKLHTFSVAGGILHKELWPDYLSTIYLTSNIFTSENQTGCYSSQSRKWIFK